MTGSGVAAMSMLRSPGPPRIATVVVAVCVHGPFVSVTARFTEPEAPALNVIDGVPLPAVIVPLAIDHEYVVPAGPGATDAVLPVEFGVTEAGAVIVMAASVETVTVFEADAEQPLASVTCTLYVVVAVGVTVIDAVVAPVDHRNDVPPEAVRLTLEPAQADVGPVMVAVGGAFTVIVFVAEFGQPTPSVTLTL
jgi:hypothetical protein